MGRPSFRHGAAAVAIGIGLAVTIPVSPLAQGHRRGGSEDVPIFIVPTRAPAAARPASPPDLPREALALVSATLQLQTTRGASGAAVVQTVTRTADRVHVETGAGRELLYMRNPTDVRRVSAMLTDHTARTTVVYDESDLRRVLGIRGWLDVLTLGFDPGRFAELRPVSGTRRAFDLPFEHLEGPGSADGVLEAWWHQGELLPLEVVRRRPESDAPVVVTVVQRSLAVDRQRLALPTTRFPDYRQLDFADWLEGLHER